MLAVVENVAVLLWNKIALAVETKGGPQKPQNVPVTKPPVKSMEPFCSKVAEMLRACVPPFAVVLNLPVAGLNKSPKRVPPKLLAVAVPPATRTCPVASRVAAP